MAKANDTIQLLRLRIENFKAIDSLELEFPQPRMAGDPDIFAMGSKNGLGKTSILESCAFLSWAASSGKSEHTLSRPDFPVNFPELFVRSGAEKASLQGTFQVGKDDLDISLTIHRDGKVTIENDAAKFKAILRTRSYPPDLEERFFFSLSGINVEPVILPSCLYFHSYRKVQEGNPELGMLVEGERYRPPFIRGRYRPGGEVLISTFKLQILRAMMGQANLFEDLDNKQSKDTLDKLNGLVERYAGGKIERLRPSSDNTIEFRISPTHGGSSFTFDGLSSGQKEIISTLFLIWHYTNNASRIVLIDEPELHLNVEWHRDFMQQVCALVPQNQYIIATHSEDVFASVPQERRILLDNKPSSENKSKR